MIARVDGSWCYLGTFQSAGVEAVAYGEWAELPEHVGGRSIVQGRRD